MSDDMIRNMLADGGGDGMHNGGDDGLNGYGYNMANDSVAGDGVNLITFPINRFTPFIPYPSLIIPHPSLFTRPLISFLQDCSGSLHLQ
jgi:hypothetical protein